MIKILNSNFERQAILKEIINPNRFEELNGENTLTFSAILDEKTGTFIDENTVLELDDDYFDIAYFSKNQNEDGTLTINVEAEHISYRLNEPDYDMEYFASTGTPTEVLTALLSGTGFTVGTVAFTGNVTYSIQEKKSRRMMLMEFATLLGGEVDFNKFTISIHQHRGNSEPKLLTKGKNIKIVSKIYNKREKDQDGNPLISYTCTPIILPDTPLGLGDEVLLIQKDLGIQEQLRIVRIGYNPYDPVEAEIELANFVSGLEDDIYRIQTTTVAKNKVYNGCRIGPEEGFVAERSDGKAKTVLNATEGISIYSNLGSGLVKNFFVDTDGRIKAKGIDIDGSGTFSGTIKANQLLIGGDNGSISFEDLSDKPTPYTDSDALAAWVASGYSTFINSSGVYTGTIAANQILIGGENGSISFNDLTDKPTAETIGAKPYDWQPSYGDITGIKPPANADNTIDTIGSNRLTYIDQNGIYTGTLTAQQINAIQGIVLGANATIQWASLPSLPTASQIGALPDNTFIPDASYITTITKDTVTTTYVNALNVHAGSVDAENITGTYITGKTIRTASSGKRLEMNSTGIISYNSSGQKAGVCIENDPSSGYSKVEFYHNGIFVGSIGLNGLGQYNLIASRIDVQGAMYYNGSEVATFSDIPSLSGYATLSWVSSNFASNTHGHGNDYVKSRVGENLSIAATEAGIVIRRGETVLGSLLFD